MRDNELKHLGNVLADLPMDELHTVLEQFKHKLGFNQISKSKEDNVVDFLQFLETATRVKYYDYFGNPEIEEQLEDHKNYPDIYVGLPHVVRLSEEEINDFIFMHNEIKRRFNSDAFVWSDYDKIYHKIIGPVKEPLEAQENYNQTQAITK